MCTIWSISANLLNVKYHLADYTQTQTESEAFQAHMFYGTRLFKFKPNSASIMQ